MQRVWIVISAAAALFAGAAPLQAKKPDLPRIPGQTLLVGWPPFSLTLTAGQNTWPVQDEPHSDWLVAPSLSANATIVASARPIAGALPRSSDLIVSLWSMTNHDWTDYPALSLNGGAVSISPDGNRVACVTRWMTDAPSRIEVLDRTTGKITLGPEVYERAGTDISWAPDSLRLAFDMGSNGAPVKSNPSPLRAIYIMETDAGTVRRIAQAVAPSWSPSGEWIAYLDYAPDNDDAGPGLAAAHPNRVGLMHPDGSGARVLMTLPRDESLMIPPVWSPDSQAILLNRWHDRQKGTMDVDRLEIGAAKITREFRNVPPVYAWIGAQP